jgi:hypothetical protein
MTPSNPTVCPRCGAPLKPDAKFCNQCGAAVDEGGNAAIPPVLHCPRCQSALRPGAPFCSRCGTQVMAQLQPAAVSEAWSPGPAETPPAPDSTLSRIGQETWRTRILGRSQLWWDALAIGGGALTGVLWYAYSSVRAVQEGGIKDPHTALLMLLIPIGIVAFRKPVDKLLLPLDAIRRRIPRLVLVGAGLAAPYAVAGHMYGKTYFGVYMDQFPYMRAAMVVGILVSYIILRTPQGQPPRSPRPLTGTLTSFLLVVMVWSIAPATAWADDFRRDLWNIRDGLRTPGWAPAIAGTAAVIASVLVNGSEIIRTILRPPSVDSVQPPAPPTNGEQKEAEKPKQYTLDIRTQDQRTTLIADGEDIVWIYGQVLCDDPNIDTGTITRGLSFAADGPNASWLVLGEPEMVGGFKVTMVRAWPPTEEAVLEDDGAMVVASASIEGNQVGGPVQLTLEDSLYELEVF